MSSQHLEKYNANGIKIWFVGIVIPSQCFWRHIERCSNVNPILKAKSGSGSKTKIWQFPLIPHSQNISRFDIPMDDSLFKEVLVALVNLFHDLDCVSLAELLFLGYVLIQVAMRAVLHH